MGFDSGKFFVFFTIYLNVVLAAADKISQIVYYWLTDKIFIYPEIRNTCLAFILIKPCANILMITMYLISHNDNNITVRTKIKYFFLYVISAEFCYSIGAHKTFKSKYSQYADNILITKKVLNMMHIMFVSLAQILIISIHSSALQNFQTIDIVSLCFSCLFITWSIIYYFLCGAKESDYEAELELVVN
jgi:hypothetical protein